MQLLRRVFNFYIFSNIHVALATFSLTKITLLTFDNQSNELPLFVFCSTVLSYNFIRIYRKITINTWLSNWIDANRIGIVTVSILSFIGIVYIGFNVSINALLFLIPFGGLTLFYVFPLPLFLKNNTSLRTIARLKIFLIAFCWAGITVLFPLINYEVVFSSDLFIIFLQRFLFVVVITIPFDIRDVSYDATSLKTLPQILGVEKAKRLGLFLLMLFLGLLFLRTSIDESLIRIEFGIALLSLFFLIRSKEIQSSYYSAFFVESIPIIWLLLLLIM
jgi:hypothetical protein